jgi:heme-degrading monooxygenase HmoA
MYFAMNRFQVASGREEEFEEMWRRRESTLHETPGFVAFYMLRSEDGEFISCSQWEDERAFLRWTESDSFAKTHARAGPPRFTGYSVVLSDAGVRPRR